MNLFHVCSLKAWQPACAPVSIVLAADFHTAWTVYFWVPSPARLPADGNSCGLHQGQRDLSLYYQVQHKLCFHPTVPDPLRVSHYTPVTLHESERFNAFLPRFARFCGWMVYFINSNLCFEGTAVSFWFTRKTFTAPDHHRQLQYAHSPPSVWTLTVCFFLSRGLYESSQGESRVWGYVF